MPHLLGKNMEESSDPRLRKAFRLGRRDAARGSVMDSVAALRSGLGFDWDETAAYFEGVTVQIETAGEEKMKEIQHHPKETLGVKPA